MDNFHILFSGNLLKSPPVQKSKIILIKKRWKLRFFCLKRLANSACVLEYFTNSSMTTCKGTVDLHNLSNVVSNAKFENLPNVFTLSTLFKDRERVYYFSASSPAEMDEWVKQICIVCKMEFTGDPVLESHTMPNIVPWSSRTSTNSSLSSMASAHQSPLPGAINTGQRRPSAPQIGLNSRTSAVSPPGRNTITAATLSFPRQTINSMVSLGHQPVKTTSSIDPIIESEVYNDPKQADPDVYNDPKQDDVYNDPKQDDVYNDPKQDDVYNDPKQDDVYNDPKQDDVYNDPKQDDVYNNTREPELPIKDRGRTRPVPPTPSKQHNHPNDHNAIVDQQNNSCPTTDSGISDQLDDPFDPKQSSPKDKRHSYVNISDVVQQAREQGVINLDPNSPHAIPQVPSRPSRVKSQKQLPYDDDDEEEDVYFMPKDCEFESPSTKAFQTSTSVSGMPVRPDRPSQSSRFPRDSAKLSSTEMDLSEAKLFRRSCLDSVTSTFQESPAITNSRKEQNSPGPYEFDEDDDESEESEYDNDNDNTPPASHQSVTGSSVPSAQSSGAKDETKDPEKEVVYIKLENLRCDSSKKVFFRHERTMITSIDMDSTCALASVINESPLFNRNA